MFGLGVTLFGTFAGKKRQPPSPIHPRKRAFGHPCTGGPGVWHWTSMMSVARVCKGPKSGSRSLLNSLHILRR